jgi:hypothetical protein
MFIKYKNQPPINTFLIYCIRFHEPYIIEFYSENMRVCWWEFPTKEERQEVYKKVLEMIKVREISLGNEEPPIEVMETIRCL